MSAIRKSDSQLDAEAALRKSTVLIVCRTVLNDGRPCAVQSISGGLHLHRMTPADLRLLYQDESSLRRMTSSAPPVVFNITEHTRPDGSVYWEGEPFGEPPDRIGQSLSGELVALIGQIRADFVSYGPRHPIRRAMAEWDRTCRRRHRAPTWHSHPLCGEMLSAVVNGCSILWCAERYQLSYPRAERLIAAGLRFVGERYARNQDDQLGIVHDRDRCSVCREEAKA